jgi:chorismate synthase
MSGNSFGQIFRISTWGESHGGGVGVVIDGCPSGVAINLGIIQKELDRRKPGQSQITTQRDEADEVEILSGVFMGKTLGTPIAMLVRNKDAKSEDYENLKTQFRPGHADFTYEQKYGIRNYAGGGRASARETIGRVAAGAIAKEYLSQKHGVEIIAFVSQIAHLKAQIGEKLNAAQVDQNIVRCPDQAIAKEMIKLIEETAQKGDTIGGLVTAHIYGSPVGLGEPVFDKLEADLAKAMMSLPATKSFEIGSGRECLNMLGSEHNDIFESFENGILKTKTNHAGGVLGGISNGEDIVFHIAFKPVSTIFQVQETLDIHGEKQELKMKGRHDPCVVPRAVPIVEAMAALVLADHDLRNRAAKF